MSDFVRNYKAFLQRIKQTGRPEVLTVNGRPEYVILDAESYQKIADELERARFVQAVREGIDQMKAGDGASPKEAFDKVRSDLGP
ncbi:MAG: hypothetical protein QOJ65_2317 [Fimbriimonadaceae bacterium]|nr:hypothetical protein [Fimbriimonadaceae bacterium]